MLRVIVSLVSVLALSAQAEASDVAAGQRLYIDLCATCHGEDATGDGPMVAVLVGTVPDLTRIAERNGGAYSTLEVARTIDGQETLLAHGGPMPLFGQLLRGESVAIEAADGVNFVTAKAIVDIAAYLETLQR